MVGPILAPMLRLGDPHRLTLRGARLISIRMSSDVDFRMVRWRGAESAGDRAPNREHLAELPRAHGGPNSGVDFAMFPGLDMLVAPTIFGVPPFDSLAVICDARAVESVPWDAACHRSGDRFSINGVTYGRCVQLGRFLAERGYEITEIRAEDVEVVVMDRDYRCSWRARTVLREGCAYGAPGYLARLAWTVGAVARKSFLASAQSELNETAAATQAMLDGLQQDYLRAVSGSSDIA